MADNVTIKDASGANVVTGTDEVTIGGVLQQVQRMKLVDGSDGGTSLIGSFPAGFLRVTDEPRQVFMTLSKVLPWTPIFGSLRQQAQALLVWLLAI